MKNYIYILPIILSTLCYAINQLWYHSKLKCSRPFSHGFFGGMSWSRKYSYQIIPGGRMPMVAPNTWYYRFFKIKYKERFPLSATFLVMFTDGLHLVQHLFFAFLVAAMVLTPRDWWSVGIASGVMLVSFWFWYKILSR